MILCKLITIQFMTLQSWGMGFKTTTIMASLLLFNVLSILIFAGWIEWFFYKPLVFLALALVLALGYDIILGLFFKEELVGKLKRLNKMLPRRMKIIRNISVATYEILSFAFVIYAFRMLALAH